MSTGSIQGGYYIKAKCIQQSEISKAPPHVRETWDWILMKANHCDNGKISRGQLLTSYKDIQEGLCWYIGYRKQQYTKAQIETAMKYLRKTAMVTTTRTTRGTVITVLNYDKYQDTKNYENRNGTATKDARKPHDTKGRNKEYLETSNEIRLAKYLFGYMRKNNPEVKQPKSFQGWAKHFDYILRIDGRDLEEVKSVIRWCQSNSFWFKNILSPQKLREKYDQLLLNMPNKTPQVEEEKDWIE